MRFLFWISGWPTHVRKISLLWKSMLSKLYSRIRRHSVFLPHAPGEVQGSDLREKSIALKVRKLRYIHLTALLWISIHTASISYKSSPFNGKGWGRRGGQGAIGHARGTFCIIHWRPTRRCGNRVCSLSTSHLLVPEETSNEFTHINYRVFKSSSPPPSPSSSPSVAFLGSALCPKISLFPDIFRIKERKTEKKETKKERKTMWSPGSMFLKIYIPEVFLLAYHIFHSF